MQRLAETPLPKISLEEGKGNWSGWEGLEARGEPRHEALTAMWQAWCAPAEEEEEEEVVNLLEV